MSSILPSCIPRQLRCLILKTVDIIIHRTILWTSESLHMTYREVYSKVEHATSFQLACFAGSIFVICASTPAMTRHISSIVPDPNVPGILFELLISAARWHIVSHITFDPCRSNSRASSSRSLYHICTTSRRLLTLSLNIQSMICNSFVVLATGFSVLPRTTILRAEETRIVV
jgi:hypothetical protein